MPLSIYETEKRAREQGFAFVIEPILSRYESFGYVQFSTAAEAFDAGRRDVKDQRYPQFKVWKMSLKAPFTSEEVTV